MALQIEGTSTAGDGGVKRVLVTNKGRINALAASQSDTVAAVLDGNGFNLNTGVIGSLATADSAVLYYKHNEDIPIVIDTVVVGLTDADTNNPHVIKIIRNPKNGTIVSGASAGDISQNRNFDSGLTLVNSTFYKGADGNTFTDGDDYILSYAGENGRSVLPISTVLRRGNSFGVTITPSLATGTISGYFALVCYLSDL